MKKNSDLDSLKAALPYQYGRLIAKRLANVTPKQVRLVFSDQISDPGIVLPVLEEAHRLHEETKKIAALKSFSKRECVATG